MGLEEIRWRKECGMGERQTKHTKTENRKKKKREQNTPSKAEQLQCAFRFAAIPGLQAKLVQKMVPKSMLFLALVFVKILVRFGVPFGVPFW